MEKSLLSPPGITVAVEPEWSGNPSRVITEETVTLPAPVLPMPVLSWEARAASQGEGSPVAAATALITLLPVTLPSWIFIVRTLLARSQVACAPTTVGSLRMRKLLPLRLAAVGRLARLD